jgi:hypothetical protein
MRERAVCATIYAQGLNYHPADLFADDENEIDHPGMRQPAHST